MINTKFKFQVGDRVKSTDHHSENGSVTTNQRLINGATIVSVSISKYCTLIRPENCWEIMND